jgi:metal-dependent hydrolase (beta-lactamase superfamily II)
MPGAGPAKAQITVLYDAFGKPSVMQKDWGYAALIEYGGNRILFYTGNDPEILAQNVKAKGVDLTKLDFVVLSHRHGDHMGGLTHVLEVNPTVKIYAPREEVRGLRCRLTGQLLSQGHVSPHGAALLRREAAGSHAIWIGLAGS